MFGSIVIAISTFDHHELGELRLTLFSLHICESLLSRSMSSSVL